METVQNAIFSLESATIVEACKLANVQHATWNTYIYVTKKGEIVAIEKGTRDAFPINQEWGYGYVSSFGTLKEINPQL